MISSKTKNYQILWKVPLLFILSSSTIYSSHYLVSSVIQVPFRLVEVVGHKHFPWNPNDLVYSDQKQASKSYILVPLKQYHYLIECFQRAGPIASGRLYILLCSSFIQIRRITSNIFVDFSCLLCEIPNRLDGLFYSLILYGMTCLCKLLNRLDGLFYPLTLDGLFTYYASYQINQINSSTLWYLTACLLCKTPNRSDRLFYPLILNGSFAISKRLGSDYRHGLYTTKILVNIWSIRLVSLIYRYHSDSCFKVIGGQGSIFMIMMRLTRIVWCWCNEIDKRKAYSGGKEDWRMKLTSHV